MTDVNKKVFVIISILVILLIVLSVSFGFKSSSSVQPEQNSKTKSRIINSNPSPANSLKTYHTNSYILSYPNNWSKNETNINNEGGMLVTFQPQEVNSGNFARISVEVLNEQTTSISTLTRIFTLLHYSETNSIIAGITALKYTAVLPTQNSYLHSIAYILRKNEKIYTIKLEYTQPDRNSQLEGQFSQLLNSFSFQ